MGQTESVDMRRHLDASIDAGHLPAYLLVNEHLCGLVYVSV